MAGHGTSIKMSFFLGLPSGSPEIPKLGTLMSLGVYNFLYKPLIEMRSEAKLSTSSRAFQCYVTRKEIRAIPDF
jgi:hypothetical protein